MAPSGTPYFDGAVLLKRFAISRAVSAPLIGIGVVGAEGLAHADFKDFEFKRVQPIIAGGKFPAQKCEALQRKVRR